MFSHTAWTVCYSGEITLCCPGLPESNFKAQIPIHLGHLFSSNPCPISPLFSFSFQKIQNFYSVPVKMSNSLVSLCSFSVDEEGRHMLGRQLLYHWVTWEAHTVHDRTVVSDFFTLRHSLICSMSSEGRVKSSAFEHSAASWELDKNCSSGLRGQSESRGLGLGTKGTSKKWAQTPRAPFYLNIFASS